MRVGKPLSSENSMETFKIHPIHTADGGFPINDEVTFRLFILLFIYKLQQKIFFQDLGVHIMAI